MTTINTDADYPLLRWYATRHSTSKLHHEIRDLFDEVDEMRERVSFAAEYRAARAAIRELLAELDAERARVENAHAEIALLNSTLRSYRAGSAS